MTYTISRRKNIGLMASLVAIIVALVATSMPAVAVNRMPYPSITLKANTYMQINWNGVSGATSYALQYSKSSNFSGAVTRLPDASPTEVQINGLTPNTKYYFRIRPRTGSSNMANWDWSATSSGYTTSTAFSPPSRPSISRARKDGFKIAWGEVPNASRYRVQMSTNSSFSGTGTPGGSGGAPVYLLSKNTANSMYVGNGAGDGNPTQEVNGVEQGPWPMNLITPSTTYYIRVKALEAKVDPATGKVYDLTGYSSTTSFKTHATWTAFPVNDLKVTSSKLNAITLEFEDLRAQQFDDSTDTPDAYRVQYWTGSGAKYYVNTDVMDGTTGEVNGVGSGGTVQLTLKKLCNSAAGTDSCTPFVVGSTYRFRITPLKAGVALADYTDSAGIPAVASGYSLTTPNNVRVDSANDSAIKVSWDEVAGATSYRLQQKQTSTSGTTRYLYDICDSGTAPKFACTTSAGRVQVTLPAFADNSSGGSSSALGLGKTYYFRVAAQSGDSSTPGIQERASDYTGSYIKTVTPGWLLQPPANIERVASTGSTVTLQWDPSRKWDGSPAGVAVRYRLQVSLKSDMTGTMTYPYTPIYAAGDVNKVQFKVTGLSGERTYYFRVRAVDTNNSATYSDYVARALTAQTTSAVGSIVTTLNTAPGCSAADYRLAAYWGDEVVDTVGPQSIGSPSTFRMDGVREGSAYKLQYSYVGQGNCVSPWISNSTDIDAQSHVLKVYASSYPVVGTQVTTISETQDAIAGVAVGGVLKTSGGAGLSYADVTALGAPADGSEANPNRGYREVHDLTLTGGGGAFGLSGLWPNQKYNVYFRSTAPGMTGVYLSDGFWCNAVTTGNPGQSLDLTMGNVSAGKNCVG